MDLVEVCTRDIFWYRGISNFHGSQGFCYYCKLCHDSNVGLVSSKADPAFVKTGFCNWKKGMEKFKDHESSLAHKNSLVAIISSRNVSVSNLIQQGLHKEQVQRRESLHKELAALCFLL